MRIDIDVDIDVDVFFPQCRNNKNHGICMLVVCHILVKTTQKIHGNLTVFDLQSYRSSWIMKFVVMDIWKFWYTYG